MCELSSKNILIISHCLSIFQMWEGYTCLTVNNIMKIQTFCFASDNHQQIFWHNSKGLSKAWNNLLSLWMGFGSIKTFLWWKLTIFEVNLVVNYYLELFWLTETITTSIFFELQENKINKSIYNNCLPPWIAKSWKRKIIEPAKWSMGISLVFSNKWQGWYDVYYVANNKKRKK